MNIRTQNKVVTVVFLVFTMGLGVVSTHAAQQTVSLHDAVSRYDVATVRRLLETVAGRAQVNALDSDRKGLGWTATPLYLATFDNHADMVQLLLKHGADPEKRTLHGGLPLHWAIVNGYQDVVKSLLEGDADVHAHVRGSMALAEAISGLHLPSALLLIDYGTDIPAISKTTPQVPRRKRRPCREQTRQKNIRNEVRKRYAERMEAIKVWREQLHHTCGVSTAVVNHIILPMALTDAQQAGVRSRDSMSSPSLRK